jgi:sulfatase maturation enzyme AslB (radical SAM superfamily)
MQMQETLAPPKAPALLECELTGLCNLACGHCYADSSPHGDHGAMTTRDWESVIGQAAALGAKTIQFIGGEPALVPELPRLIRHALAAALKVEVFTSLVRVTGEMWDILTLPGVSLAFSWYTADPAVHARITGSKIAWNATRGNAARAVELGIPVRAEIISVEPGQDTDAARAAMLALGVSRVTVRPVRGLGRAAGGAGSNDPAQLCGRCGSNTAAIMPDGQLAPCVMGRWLNGGNVRDTPLGALLAGHAWRQALAAVPGQDRACGPSCGPSGGDGENCAPDNECPPESNTRSLLPVRVPR